MSGMLKFIYESFETNEERRRRGDDLGIFMYVSLWFFIVLIYVFSTDISIIQINTFYLFFDVISIFFIIIYLANKKFEGKDEKLFTFYKFSELMGCFIFIMVLFVLMTIISVIIFPMFRSCILTYDQIFELVRIPMVEEMVFRGFGFFIFIYIFSSMFNVQDHPKREIAIWWITIFVIGIMFGLYHVPKYMLMEEFPYLYVSSQGVIIQISVLYPIVYLSILGILIGLCKYKYGLFAAILLHGVNNYFAEIVTKLFGTIFLGGAL